MIPAATRRIDVGKLPKCPRVPQEAINALLIDLAREGHAVARLKGGDPLIFGRGSEDAADLRAAGVTVDYIPGITAAQGMAASTGVPLTHRGLATGVRYVTGHRAKDLALDLDDASLACEDTMLVVYMGAQNIAEIAFHLMRYGLPSNLPVMAVSAATTPRERRQVSTLGSIATDVARVQPDAPVLFVIGHVVSLYQDIATADAALCDGVGMAGIILDGVPGTAMPPWRPLMTEDEAMWIARYLKRE